MDQDQSLQPPIHHGYANTLTPEERQALIETLTEDLSLQKREDLSSNFTAELMFCALEDAKGN